MMSLRSTKLTDQKRGGMARMEATPALLRLIVSQILSLDIGCLARSLQLTF